MDCNRRCQTEGNTLKDRLPVKQKISYGVGHILNDLAASVWFSYLIIYLTKVAQLSNRYTGLVVFLGQIADAVFTPFIGILCDRTVCRYGRRKIWHLIGTVLTSLSFPMLFIRILPDAASASLKVCYFVGVAAVFQFGWGCVQISHLSLIPEICYRNNERIELNAIRSALTFASGIFVYGVTWILLGESKDAALSPNVWKQFMFLSFIIVGTGNLFNVFFHVNTKEPDSLALKHWRALRQDKKRALQAANHCNGNEVNNKVVYQQGCSPNHHSGVSLFGEKAACKRPRDGFALRNTDCNNTNEHATLMGSDSQEETTFEIIDRSANRQTSIVKTKKQWLKDPKLYKVALIYMCTRIVVNVSQSYLPIYLTETMKFEKESIAYFPLVMLISGVLASLGVKHLTKKLGSKITYCMGSLMAIGACLWYFVQSVEGRYAIYATTVLMGVGCSIMLVTALSLISELIGHDKKSGAFIYGAVSFTDKLSSGALIAIIQELNPRTSTTVLCPTCDEYVRYIQSMAPGVAAVIALLTAIFFFDSVFVCSRRVEQRDAGVQVNLDIETTRDDEQENLSEEDCTHTKQVDHVSVISRSSLETRNFLNVATANEEYAAHRLASPYLSSPLLDRRTIV